MIKLYKKIKWILFGKPKIFKPYPEISDLPNLVHRAFIKNGFLRVSEMCSYTRDELNDMPGFGPKTMEALDIFYEKYDIEYVKS